MRGIRGIATAGAALVVLGGGVLLVGVTTGSTSAICGPEGSGVAAQVASRRVELQQGLTPVLPGVQVRTLIAGEAPTLACADQAPEVAAVPAVAGEVQLPAWLVREKAGGPPHCAVA